MTVFAGPPCAPPEYPRTFWQLVKRAASQYGDAILLADDHGRSLTAEQLRAASEGVAAGLLAQGVRDESVVSWQLPTTFEAMVVQLALSRLSAVQNPVIPDPPRARGVFIAEQVGTEFLVVPETWRGFAYGALARALASDHDLTVVLCDHRPNDLADVVARRRVAGSSHSEQGGDELRAFGS